VARRSTGIVRRLDRLGRIVIPKEVRDAFRIGRDAQLAFAVDGDAVVLQLPELTCLFCGTAEHVIPHRGKGICVECAREVRELASPPQAD
jgi:transcriptional pleiotropic regulator of transition state genes